MTNVVMQRANVFLDCVLGGRCVVTIHSHQFVMDTCILNRDYYYMTSQNTFTINNTGFSYNFYIKLSLNTIDVLVFNKFTIIYKPGFQKYYYVIDLSNTHIFIKTTIG